MVNHPNWSKNKQIVVVIPAYNESIHIQDVIVRSLVYLPVLVVDDGSKDRTADLAEQAGASVIRQSPNQGKGAALRAGFTWAINNQFDYVITIDADGQHKPEELPKFMAKIDGGPIDLLAGARNFRNMPFRRRIANMIGRIIFSAAIGQNIQDNQTGYRLVSKRLMEKMLDSTESGFEFEVEMITTCLKHGWILDWVPIETIYRDEKSHIKPIPHVLNFLRVAIKARKVLHS